ncbi:MAG: 1-acyl-sn-glycerol-3-phosphate acyltransferase [Spirochaetales bacterium]|jgi:1-acyl-sn-glycerol-3-phosphate acyltransferase|nr:1-acyl-sn-glycerol-3-phosphate acyltransferase [Spirochaetales bacterium]
MAVKLASNPKMINFLRRTVGVFLYTRYKLRVENRHIVTELEPPFAILPNHVGFWDPFFVGLYTPQTVHYVVSDFQFRIPVMKFLLGLVGAIPKSKAISDFETVRNIFRVKKLKEVIGIFPEGMRNWDGHSLKPLFTTSKLIKALKIPVVIPILKGAYICLPRWSRKRSNGPITVDFKMGFTVDELKTMSAEAIHTRLGELLLYDEWDYQREHMNKYRGRHRAEHVELALFMCPECNAIGTLRSKLHTLRCTGCGYSVDYNVHGFFERKKGVLHHETVRTWNLWQLDRTKVLLSKLEKDKSSEPIFTDDNLVIWRGFRREPMVEHDRGRLSLFTDRIEFVSDSGEKMDFMFQDIHGINVQVREVVEFYHNEALYIFRFSDPWVSGYKWMVSVNYLNGKDPLNAEFLD